MRFYSHVFKGDGKTCEHTVGSERCAMVRGHSLHLEDKGKPLNHPVASEELDETMGRSDLDDGTFKVRTAPEPEPPASDALQAWDEFAAHVRTLIAEKDVAYGGAWRAQGWMGNLARVMSKHARLRNMLWRSDPVKFAGNEGIHDTLADLAALCAFTTANIMSDNQWGREP